MEGPITRWMAVRQNNQKAIGLAADGDTHQGYGSIALLPNLGGTGNVLIVTGTGEQRAQRRR